MDGVEADLGGHDSTMTTAPESADEICIGGSLGSMSRALARQVEEITAPQGLTADQWYALDEVLQNDGIAMTELARRLNIPAPTLTKFVDRLVSGALAFRLADHADKRRVLVHGSQRGSLIHATLLPDVRRIEATFIEAISEYDRKVLSRILDGGGTAPALSSRAQ